MASVVNAETKSNTTVTYFFSTAMKGTLNDKGNCVYRDDDMIMTEDEMLEAFGLAYNR